MTLDAAVVDRYLGRIGLRRSEVTVDLEGLARLQYAHLTHVPFTNLDVYERLDVRTSLDWSVPAVIEGRGGWCFVDNGAFSALLESLGFEVVRMGALVVMTADISPMDDHLTLRVELDRPYLVDVGFGESFTRPIPLDTDAPVEDVAAGRRFRLSRGDDGRRQLESEQRIDGSPVWRLDYRFEEVPRDLDYFTPANEYLRTEPGLMWTTKRFSTRLTEDGRVTLLDDRIKFAPLYGDELVEPLDDEAAWEAARRRHLPTPG